MPAASLLLPPGLLAAAALASFAFGLARRHGSRVLTAGAGWLALAAVCGAWWGVAGRQPVDLATPLTVAGVGVGFRLDSLTVTFELAVLLPFALLAGFQPRSALQSGLAALAACAALLTIEADRLLLAALGLSVCASVMAVALRGEEERGFPGFWISVVGAGLALLWAAVTLEALSGTSAYAAVPVTVLKVPVFVLLGLATAAAAGLVPWRAWPSQAWTRGSLATGPLAVALIPPLGLLLLVRAYGLGAGRWPHPSLNLAVAVLAAAAALGAAVRAQAAADRRGYLAEMVPLGNALAVIGLSLGSPLGVSAGLTALLGSALAAGLAPLLAPGEAQPPRALTTVGLLVLAGAPPALVFGGRLLALQAGFENGAAFAFLSLAGALAWLTAAAGGARALRLPAGAAGERDRVGLAAALAIALAGGVALGALVALLTVPAATEVIPRPASVVTGGPLAVTTPSGGWAAVLLGAPLLVLGAIGLRVAYRAPAPSEPRPPETAAPFFGPPLAGAGPALRARLAALPLARGVGGILSPAGIESAMTGSRPWFWAAVTLALAFVVTR